VYITGESFVSLHYTYRLGRSTVGAIVQETCQALVTVLQADFLKVKLIPFVHFCAAKLLSSRGGSREGAEGRDWPNRTLLIFDVHAPRPSAPSLDPPQLSSIEHSHYHQHHQVTIVLSEIGTQHMK